MSARLIGIALLAWAALTNAAAADPCCRASPRPCSERPCSAPAYTVRPAQPYVVLPQPVVISAQPVQVYVRPSCYMQRLRVWDTFNRQWMLWTNRVCE